jgi:hypothetical protein
MYRMIEDRAAMGKSTLLKYKGKSVGSKKLVRYAKDQSNKSLVRRNMVDTGANSFTKQDQPAIRMATTM